MARADIPVVRIPDDLGEHSEHEVYRAGGGTLVSYLNRDVGTQQRVLMCAPTLVYVRRGTKRLERAGCTSEVRAGSLVLVHRGLHLMTETLDGTAPYASTLLCLEGGVLRELASRHPNVWESATVAEPGFEVVDPGGYVADLFESLPRLVAHHPDRRLLALKVEEVMLALDQPAARRFWATAIREAMTEGDARLRAVVDRHCLTPVTAPELAVLSGRSLSTFKRDFSRLYDQSPGRWLLARRLEHARGLLAHRSANVTEACWQSGFSDVSSFIRAFKRVYQTTPKRYQLSALSHQAESARDGASRNEAPRDRAPSRASRARSNARDGSQSPAAG